jgi:hypothetical protein
MYPVRDWKLSVGGGFLALGISTCTALPAQSVRPSQKLEARFIAPEGKASLSELLGLLARSGVRVLADGIPVTENIELQHEGTIRSALDKIAKQLDYTWTLSRNGVVLMRKKFSNEKERPQAHRAELMQVAQDMLTILPDLEPDPENKVWGRYLFQLGQTLTPAQLAQLRNGKRLDYSELTPEQRRLGERALMAVTYGTPRGIWDRMLTRMKALPQSFFTLVDEGSWLLEKGVKKPYYVLHLSIPGPNNQPVLLKRLGSFLQEEFQKPKQQERQP